MDTTAIDGPATPAFIPVVRSVAGNLAALADLPIEAVEDVRLAATEACSYLLRIAPAARSLHARITSEAGIVQIVASVEDASAPHRDAGDIDFITWHLLGAFTDGASLEWTVEGPAIRFHRVRRS